MPFLQIIFFCWQPPQKDYFLGFFWNFRFPCFSYFLKFLHQHKKRQKQKCTSFFKTPFLTPWQTAKIYFRTPTHYLCAFFKIPEKHYKIGGKQATRILDQVLMQLWTKFWLNKPQILDQVLTLQHIYICVYIYTVYRDIHPYPVGLSCGHVFPV